MTSVALRIASCKREFPEPKIQTAAHRLVADIRLGDPHRPRWMRESHSKAKKLPAKFSREGKGLILLYVVPGIRHGR
jgi:hypothetical protein